MTDTETVRVTVTLDVPLAQAADPADLIASVYARVEQEAGYLDTGEPVMPVRAYVRIDADEPPASGRRFAVVVFDVTDLDVEEVDAVLIEATVQGEASDDHRDTGPTRAFVVDATSLDEVEGAVNVGLGL